MVIRSNWHITEDFQSALLRQLYSVMVHHLKTLMCLAKLCSITASDPLPRSDEVVDNSAPNPICCEFQIHYYNGNGAHHCSESSIVYAFLFISNGCCRLYHLLESIIDACLKSTSSDSQHTFRILNQKTDDNLRIQVKFCIILSTIRTWVVISCMITG